MKIDILYEDKDIVAINKPAGLVVHSDGRTEEETLADWVLENYPKTKNVGEPTRGQNGEEILRPGIVHRLDRETSGVMLIAKTQKGFETLKKQFQEHQIQKTYHTFVYGEMSPYGRSLEGRKNNKGVIDRAIGRSSKDFRLKSAQRGAKGEMREAVTEYEVIFRGLGYSFVKVTPKTGRTHQIRVHFKAINYPLVSDKLYAPNIIKQRENTLGFKRLALHSYEIKFADVKGKEHSVTAPYPPDFVYALSLLQK
jgi:23S rRNA pseudouridine1911/1915/1917 synthase